MIKSIVVAYFNFRIDGMMSCIKGKENGFNPRKSGINRIVLFFLGIAKEGHARSEDFIGDSTHCSTNLAPSFFIVSFKECGIRQGFAQKGFSLSFSSKETGELVHLPLFPRKAWMFVRSIDKSLAFPVR